MVCAGGSGSSSSTSGAADVACAAGGLSERADSTATWAAIAGGSAVGGSPAAAARAAGEACAAGDSPELADGGAGLASTCCASGVGSSARCTVAGVPERASDGTAKLASCDGCPQTRHAVGTAEGGLASGPDSAVLALGTPDRACSAGGLSADGLAMLAAPRLGSS